MGKNKENLNIFLLHFLERLNSNEPNKRKVIESLTDFCNYYDFTKGFIYQTDGFRYFLLKETIGNEGGTMKSRFDMGELKKEHVDAMKARDKPFYGNRNADASWDDIDILDFYGEDSLLIRHFEDTEGKIIGFIGFAGREEETYLTEEELQIIHLLLGSFSKEIAVREYKEREVRASNTLGSIMNNMGVDIYVNSFDSHDMLYANRSMVEPYGGIEHFWGKKCWEALYSDKTGECEFCPKRHLIDENGHPTKVYSWDYQRPFDKCWFRVFSAAFAWVDGQMAHVITSVDIDHQKKIEEELRVAKDKAEHLDRLKSAFLANMSHEIRTPLNSIVGFASIIAELDDREERQEYLAIMQENTELLLQLISDILDLAKIEAGTLDYNMGYVDVSDFCKDVMRNYDIKEDKAVPVLLAPDLPDYRIYTDKERQDYVDIMQENTELLLQLISDILDLSKIEAGTLDFTMDYLDIKSFCEDIIRNYDIKEDKPVPVLLAPTLPNFYIYTDKKRLMQVVTNFINNALKFTSEGQILLEYHPVEGTGQIEFSVTDTGMGIAPDAVATVFDRFVKLNTFAKGTGLGLSICKSIIEHLGGTIGAESELGVGSRFWFRHPCAE